MTYGNSYIDNLIRNNLKRKSNKMMICSHPKKNLRFKSRTLRNNNQQRPHLQMKIGIMANLKNTKTKTILRSSHSFKSLHAVYSIHVIKSRTLALGCGAPKESKTSPSF